MLKRHLFTVWIQQELFRHLEILAANDKTYEFKRERTFGILAKIPIANTFSELVEMDFVDYGDHAAFLRIRDAFSRCPLAVFVGTEEKGGGQTAEIARETAIFHRLSVSGRPIFRS